MNNFKSNLEFKNKCVCVCVYYSFFENFERKFFYKYQYQHTMVTIFNL